MNSLLDDVNELLKLKQGDFGRLEHIKKTLEAGHILYISDSKYLQELTKEYLEYDTGKRFAKYNSYDYPEYANRLKDTPASEPEHISENVKEPEPKKVESNGNSFCGNCGNGIKNENFCPKCGHSIHPNVSENENYESRLKESNPQEKITYQKDKGIGIGKKLLIRLGVLFVVIIVGAIAISGIIIGSIETAMNEDQKFKDELLEGLSSSERAVRSAQLEQCRNNMAYLQSEELGKMYEQRCVDSITSAIEQRKVASNPIPVSNTENTNSKCGPGTVFDDATNTCIVG